MINRENLQSEIERLEQRKDSVLSQPINSIIIRDRARKDLGDIKSLAESISSVGLMQPPVVNEHNELVDGQRRIEAFRQLGRTEILTFRVNLEQILLGEFHANSNRKDFTCSERVAIAAAVEKYVPEHSRGVGRPARNKNVSTESEASGNDYDAESRNTDRDRNVSNVGINTKDNVVKLATFSGRQKDNVSRYFGISRNTLEKEKKIIKAAEQNPEIFDELRKKVDQRRISVDKAYNQIQKQIKKEQLLASLRNSTEIRSAFSSNVKLLHADFREKSNTISNGSIDLIFTDPPYAMEYLPLYSDLAVIADKVPEKGSKSSNLCWSFCNSKGNRDNGARRFDSLVVNRNNSIRPVRQIPFKTCRNKMETIVMVCERK